LLLPLPLLPLLPSLLLLLLLLLLMLLLLLLLLLLPSFRVALFSSAAVAAAAVVIVGAGTARSRSAGCGGGWNGTRSDQARQRLDEGGGAGAVCVGWDGASPASVGLTPSSLAWSEAVLLLRDKVPWFCVGGGVRDVVSARVWYLTA
jgi:hypothetical protein